MLRGFYITAMVLSLLSIFVCIGFMDEVSSARSNSYGYSYSGDTYGSSDSDYEYYHEKAKDATIAIGLISLVYFLIMETIFILSLIRIKTTTIKVFSIIGISLSGIMILWDGAMISSPGGVSFDEVGVAWIFYGLIMLAFSIVGTVHAFRKKA